MSNRATMGDMADVPAPLDSVDLRLIELLSEDARTSVRGLARAIGMSAGAVGERLERLEARGVIRGYRVDVDAAALGLGLEVLIGVELSQHRELIETMTSLRELPEVVEVDLVTGRWDLVVRLRLRDQAHLKEVLTKDIWALESLRHTESMIVLERHADGFNSMS